MIEAIGVPPFDLSIDGSPPGPTVAAAVRSVRLAERLSRPSQLEVEFVEGTGPDGRAPKIRIGSRLALRGPERSGVLFDGEIIAIEYAVGPDGVRRWHARAYDRLHQLRLKRSFRAVKDMTAADLARELAGGVGLSVTAVEDGPRLPHRLQSGSSDLEMLTSVCEDAGLCFSTRDRDMTWGLPTGFGPPVELKVGRDLGEFRVERNRGIEAGQVRAAGWSPYDAESHVGNGESPMPAPIAAPAPLGPDAPDVTVLGRTFVSNDEATAAARSHQLFRKQSALTLEASVIGNPLLRPGGTVEITGLPEDLPKSYVIVECLHRIDRDGFYRTDISSAPLTPARTERPLPAALLARVVDVADPDRLGRIRVSFPTLSDIESDWLPVVCAGAGPHKGFIALPDVGDRVLALPVDHDLARAVVLGGLFGSAPPDDTGVRDTAVRAHVWRTADGHRVTMDDQAETVTIESKSGHRVEMNPKGIIIHSKADLLIEAPGHHMVIRADRVDFERA
jgi:phage baseplate assembly protein gpV